MHQIQFFLPLFLRLDSSLPSCGCSGIACLSSSCASANEAEMVPQHNFARYPRDTRTCSTSLIHTLHTGSQRRYLSLATGGGHRHIEILHHRFDLVGEGTSDQQIDEFALILWVLA